MIEYILYLYIIRSLYCFVATVAVHGVVVVVVGSLVRSVLVVVRWVFLVVVVVIVVVVHMLYLNFA